MHVREQEMKPLPALFLAVKRSRACVLAPKLPAFARHVSERKKENKAIIISRLNNEDKPTSIEQLRLRLC